MTPVAWALLAFVLLAALGALLARAGRSPSGPGAATAPQEAGPPAVVPPPADAGDGRACRRCGQALGPREGVTCLECRAPHHAACYERHQGCAACGAWPAVW